MGQCEGDELNQVMWWSCLVD